MRTMPSALLVTIISRTGEHFLHGRTNAVSASATQSFNFMIGFTLIRRKWRPSAWNDVTRQWSCDLQPRSALRCSCKWDEHLPSDHRRRLPLTIVGLPWRIRTSYSAIGRCLWLRECRNH